MKIITFVCLGNICRSPAAQGIAARWANDRGWNDALKFDSAGTANYQVGKPTDVRMRQAALERGYELNFTAKQLTPDLAKGSDWLIAMDRDNLRDIAKFTRHAFPQVFLLSDFLNEQWPEDVPDPYYGGIDGFNYVLDMLEAAMPSFFLRALQEDENRLNFQTDLED
ncbi:MAG: low molecular weight protein-tyrosine-phosphatase [Planctomycetota bacterium]